MALITGIPHTLKALGLSKEALTHSALHGLQKTIRIARHSNPEHPGLNMASFTPASVNEVLKTNPLAAEYALLEEDGSANVTLYDVSRHIAALRRGVVASLYDQTHTSFGMPWYLSRYQFPAPSKEYMHHDALLSRLFALNANSTQRVSCTDEILHQSAMLVERGADHPLQSAPTDIQQRYSLMTYLSSTCRIAQPQHLDGSALNTLNIPWAALDWLEHALRTQYREERIYNPLSDTDIRPGRLQILLTSAAVDWAFANTLVLDAEFREHTNYESRPLEQHVGQTLSISNLWTINTIIAATGQHDSTAQTLARAFASAILQASAPPHQTFVSTMRSFEEQWCDTRGNLQWQRWSTVEHELDTAIRSLEA